MAYFSNGTEGDMFREKWCDRCIHDENNDCPVWNAHLAFDYQQLKEGKEELRQVLDMLIPMKDKIWPDKCKMFVEFK